MKNKIKLFGIIAVVAVILFAASCGDDVTVVRYEKSKTPKITDIWNYPMYAGEKEIPGYLIMFDDPNDDTVEYRVYFRNYVNTPSGERRDIKRLDNIRIEIDRFAVHPEPETYPGTYNDSSGQVVTTYYFKGNYGARYTYLNEIGICAVSYDERRISDIAWGKTPQYNTHYNMGSEDDSTDGAAASAP